MYPGLAGQDAIDGLFGRERTMPATEQVILTPPGRVASTI
jgi:hypothetical protein